MSHVMNKPIQEPQSKTLTPLGWKLSLACFGLPALVVAVFYYQIRPLVKYLGFSDMASYMITLCVPLALLFCTALFFFRFIEGRKLNRAAFTERMRYPSIRLADIAWGIGIAVLGILGIGLLNMQVEWFIGHGYLPIPEGLPFFDDPLAQKTSEALKLAAGGEIRGQWSLVVLFAMLYFFNIVGEELWWRGIILPRQELVFGRITWLIHGLLWASFHAFKFWSIPALLPLCLLISWISQKRKNNWAGLIAHAIVNGIAIPYIAAAVAGWI